MIRILLTLLFALCALPCHAQSSGTNVVVDENPKPTWETQKQARTFQLGIPAPRGQITDRNGYPRRWRARRRKRKRRRGRGDGRRGQRRGG